MQRLTILVSKSFIWYCLISFINVPIDQNHGIKFNLISHEFVNDWQWDLNQQMLFSRDINLCCVVLFVLSSFLATCNPYPTSLTINERCPKQTVCSLPFEPSINRFRQRLRVRIFMITHMCEISRTLVGGRQQTNPIGRKVYPSEQILFGLGGD